MKRAISVSELLAMKKQTYKLSDEWREAFGEPERNGVWFVWGSKRKRQDEFRAEAVQGTMPIRASGL